jgi:predicted RNA-binding Zn ribbon-like protein
VVFTDDTGVSLQTAVALVNSASEPDTLETIEALDAFYADYDYTGRRDNDQAELDAVRRSRVELRSLLTADRDDAVELVNTILRRYRALPQLVRHAPYDWHIHAVDAERPFAERIMVETAMAMIDVIRADDLSRLSLCADDECDGVVLDLSRNRSRRFCSTACGNRNAVAAYRARQAAAD